MPAVTIRNLSPETHRALKRRAADNGRSAEAEIRLILDDAVRPPGRLKIGSALRAFGALLHGQELQIERDKTAVDAPDFS